MKIWIDGFNVETGLNRRGFRKDGTYLDTGEFYNEKGYDIDGFSRSGYDVNGFGRDGWNKRGFNKKHIHRETGTEYDPDGFNFYGINAEGIKKSDILKEQKRIQREAEREERIKRKELEKSAEKQRLEAEKIAREKREKAEQVRKFQERNYKGYNIKGIDWEKKYDEEKERIKQQELRRNLEMVKKASHVVDLIQKMKADKISVIEQNKLLDQYFKLYPDASYEKMLNFAKNNTISKVGRINAGYIKNLHRYKELVDKYNEPFIKENCIEHYYVSINGVASKTTENDVEECVEYMIDSNIHICKSNVEEVILQRKKGLLQFETKLQKESKRKRELVEKKLKAEELKKEIQQKGKINSNSKFDWVLSKRE